MPSQAEVRRVRAALTALSSAAEADFRRVWDSLRTADRLVMSDLLADGWLAVVERYGGMASELGAEQFDRWATQLGIRPRPVIAPGVDERRANAGLGWALSTNNQAGNAAVLLDLLVKQPYRDTMQQSAWASGAAYARVPSGAETCAFCLMLASRGAVYATEESAGGSEPYHGACDCEPVLVMGDQDYPDGYDPEALYESYNQARQQADSGSTSAILSALRAQQGIN